MRPFSLLCNKFPQVSNQELLHGVVALYDVSLNDMTPDTMYSSTCDRNAKTIVLIQDEEGSVRLS